MSNIINARRQFIQACAGSAVLGTLMPGLSFAKDDQSEKILVVIELSGANDGLNTLVPYSNDSYYKLRPNIGIPAHKVLKIDDQYGFNPGMTAFRNLYKNGHVAVIHGCGYAQPSLSHFTSMAYWHTGAPNSGERYGWLGRLADAIDPNLRANYLVNIDERQSLAVTAKNHMPLVYDDPDKFVRKGFHHAREILDIKHSGSESSEIKNYINLADRHAKEASHLIKTTWDNYKTPIDYGINPMGLNKVAAMIAAGVNSKIFHTSYRHNAFDTHVQQVNLHQRLLMYVSDAIDAFMKDIKRIGREKDVTLVVFSEFGRRAAENTSMGTDHGTANHMYVIGHTVKGGHYGQAPSLTDLDEGGNLKYTVDFRSVYASVIENWMGYKNSASILHKDFDKFQLWS